MRAVIFHLDYSEKACQDHATLIIFNNSLVHTIRFSDPIFAQIQRSYWRKSTFLWAETIPEKKSHQKIEPCEPALRQSLYFLLDPTIKSRLCICPK